jgi:hypothetical protein
MESLCHVRPVSETGRLSTSLLARYGGPFDMAVVLELGTTRPCSIKPQVEDMIIDLSNIKHIGTLQPRKFWRFLTQVAEANLRNIFGHDLVKIGSGSCGVKVGKGEASLGCLIPKSHSSLYIRRRSDRADQVRMGFTDGNLKLDCGVTDIRLYGNDHVTPKDQIIDDISQRLSDVPVILSMGLTRAYASRPDFDPIHWLQVNNIHFEDDPTWQLG